MKFQHLPAALIAIGIAAFGVFPQSATPISVPTPDNTIKLSQLLASNLSNRRSDEKISPEAKAKAYARLLEGQRYIWAMSNTRRGSFPTGIQNARLARTAFRQALEIYPELAEAYTALAELAITAPPSDIDEAIDLAQLAVKIEKTNFGAHRILARLYTYKSGISTGSLNPEFVTRAVEEWTRVTEIDDRNAEGWAFLSAFYDHLNRDNERIESLQKWVGSATPLDSQFYQRIMGGRENLSPDNASLKLGEALLKAGRTKEAIDTLSVVISDDPENALAITLLSEAIKTGSDADVSSSISALQQAVFANPQSFPLVSLLSEVLAKSDDLGGAVRVLENSAHRQLGTDLEAAAECYLSIGDLYISAGKYEESIAAYEQSLRTRGLDLSSTITEDEREFIRRVYGKMIHAAKSSDHSADVRKLIEKSRSVLGKEDRFAEQELINYLRETGDRAGALSLVRSSLARSSYDEGLIRLEATILTEMGKADEAVAGFRKRSLTEGENGKPITTERKVDGTTSVSVSIPKRDRFSDLLFISQLYNQANRSREAIAAANEALAAANSPERKQIAKLSIATAQQMASEYDAAEMTLRGILKESPGNPIALNNLGYFLLERNERFEEALKLIQKAVDTDPTNPSYLDSLGWAYFKMGKFTDAETPMNQAARIDPSSSTIQEHLGDLYKKLNKNEIARKHWQKALQLAADKTDIERLVSKLN